jgi:hypothetical protein
MAKQLNFPGKSAHSAPRPIQKLSSLRRAVLLVKQSGYACPVMFAPNALNMPWRMMSASVSGAVSQSVSVVALSVALRKGNQQQFQALGLTLGRFFP